ncbi:hypothetical protein KIW84_041366 [Lathyrus oleraceus]|uniref:C3H1-type domain-containing protein n=1 Tax=Pisum sativum TaxID=3888 RepID=A0A9D5AR23_PEA|nr:hypothetical protein KIW84_041366 [Pisum sativum]
MNHPENIPTLKMSPPQFSSSSSTDIIDVTPPQFPISNNPRSASDASHSFRRSRVPDNKQSNAPNRRTGNIFFKTRICTKFGLGTCRNGENCTYAHGADEIRQPPPNWQELVGPRTEERDEKIIQKMKLCKKYCNGEICPYGDNCNFLHENPSKFRDDSWKTRESSAISIETCNNLEGSRAGSKQERGTYWKTKICLRWKNTGSCPFGDGCHFAHGDAAPWRERFCACRHRARNHVYTANVYITDPRNLLVIALLYLRAIAVCPTSAMQLSNKGRGRFFDNCHRQFVKGCPPRRCHKLQWRVYISPSNMNTLLLLLPYGIILDDRDVLIPNEHHLIEPDNHHLLVVKQVELHVPGGGIEAEAAVAIANSTKAVIPTLPTTGFSTNNAPTLPASVSAMTDTPTLPASVSAMTEEEKKAKKELLWKKLNKINRIYGDWIDDLYPDLPSTEEP